MSDSPNKTCVVYVILPIVITWHVIDESTQETHFFHSVKKKKKKEEEEEEEEERKNGSHCIVPLLIEDMLHQ